MKTQQRNIMSCLAAVAVVLAITPAIAATGMVEMINPTGARQAAMGETPVLFDSDPFNLEYNPAAIGDLTKGQVGFAHNSYIQGRSTNSLAMIFPAKGTEFGIHIRFSSIGDIEARDESPISEPLYFFSAYDFSLKMQSSVSIKPRLRLGFSLGWLMEKIDTYRKSSGAVGVGLVYRLGDYLYFHTSTVNHASNTAVDMESRMTSGKGDDNMPTIYRGGVSFHRYQMTVSADYVNIKSGESRFHVGGEYLIQQTLFLRAGYQTGYDSRSFSAGAGFVYKQFRIDYAFVPYKFDLGNSHRFTFNVTL